MADSEKELQAKRDKADKLREQIVAEEQKLAERQAEANATVEGAQLDTEIATLEARLHAAKEAAKAASVKEGSAGVLASVTEQLEAAQRQAEQPVGPVDTNAGSDPADETKE